MPRTGQKAQSTPKTPASANPKIASTSSQATTARKVAGVRKRPASPSSDKVSAKKAKVQDIQRRHVTRTAPVEIHVNDPSDDEVSDNGGEEDEVVDNGNDSELEALDRAALRKQLQAERPRWNDDVASDTEDNDEGVAGEEDNAVRPQSKRAIARQAEVPVWITPEPTDDEGHETKPALSEAADDNNMSNNVFSFTKLSVNLGWEIDAHFCPPLAGARALSITAQPPLVKALIRGAIHDAIGDALWQDAYPSIETIDDKHRQLLLEVCDKQSVLALRNRVLKDVTFTKLVSHILCIRISNLRSNARKAAAGKVESFYDLIADNLEERRKKVKDLIDSGSYIFPRSGPTKILICRTRPYEHPAVISTLREFVFLGSRTTLAAKYAGRFGIQVPELPIPMVAMVATAVHASLDEWVSGSQKKQDFNSDMYEDVYRGHELFICNMRNDKRKAYDKMMQRLYNLASSDQGRLSASVVADKVMALADLDGMEE
ncbi:hypothetical protein H0H92_003821 [Tricholoma furcatifolium]|nr:hypothetical protein H0H92_003821 [Tricholoma furcatifolium]